MTDIVLSDEARGLILELVKKKPGFEKTPRRSELREFSMQLLALFYREISHVVAERALLYLEGREFDEIVWGVDRLRVHYTRRGLHGLLSYTTCYPPAIRDEYPSRFPHVYVSTYPLQERNIFKPTLYCEFVGGTCAPILIYTCRVYDFISKCIRTRPSINRNKFLESTRSITGVNRGRLLWFT